MDGRKTPSNTSLVENYALMIVAFSLLVSWI